MIYDYTHLVTYKRPSLARRILARLFSANATYNYRGGYVMGQAGGIVSTPGSYNVAEIKLDFAKIAADRAAAGQAALVATDILELIPVAVGTWVQGVFAETQTMEGEAATISVGDGVTPAGFLTGFDANVQNNFSGSIATTPYSVAVGGGKIYNVADTIDVVLNAATFNVAKMRITAALVDLRSQR